MSAETPTLHLVDASPYIFRAYYSLPSSITTPEGAPANAVYGFASFLIKLLSDAEPTHLALAFDGSLTTSFRNELYPEYKAQRELPPEELKAQLGACREVADAFGLATFIDDRYEADDILGALWQRQRRLMQPAFHPRQLTVLGPIISEEARALVAGWAAAASSGQALNVAA